jgi:hypothetical protein
MDLENIDLEQMVIDDLAAEIQQDIDSNIMYGLMMMYWKEQGWHTVKISKFQDNHHAVDITYWLSEQGLKDKEDYYREGSEFVFQDSKHATVFALRWI